MAPEIPGYYFDTTKSKYFKIEQSHTAPPAASWSADAVKRRRLTHEAAEATRRRARLLRRHVQRHAVWEGDLVARGLLRREILGGADEDTAAAAAWARGTVDKGSVPFAAAAAAARTQRSANMPCLYVGGDDAKTGLGVAYTTLDEETLVGSYIATDDNDTISFSRTAPASSGRRQGLLRTEMIRCPQMSSVQYHRPSHKMLLTSREPDHACGVYLFSPLLSDDSDARPQWLLGETSHYQRLSFQHRSRTEWLVHQSTPAPAASPDLLCVLGTNAGLLRVLSNETLWPLTPPTSTPSKHIPQEIFTQDFLQHHPQVLLAGGRRPRLWLADLRAPAAHWRSARTASAVTHLRSVGGHTVLAAGLRSTMAAYDARWLKRPVVRFEGHKNEAHVHTGWDVCEALGLVAAAQEDGTVRLFSLKSGRCLGAGAGLADVRTDTPIRALAFRRMPRERLPSLFVGEGALLRKFSLGVRELGDEGSVVPDIKAVPQATTRADYRACREDNIAGSQRRWNSAKKRYLHLKDDKFTIVMQTYNRQHELNKTLHALLSEEIPSLLEVVVVWNNVDDKVPADYVSEHSVPVRYRQSPVNSLNQKIWPDPTYKTQAILLTDDDVYYHPSDVEFAFQAWRKFGQDRMTGALARCAEPREGGKLQYSLCSNSEDQDVYAMVLTNLAFSHISFMDYYWSEEADMAKIRDYVDQHLNCEDIAMNHVASLLTGQGPLLVTGRERYVNLEPAAGISRKPGHLEARSQCLDDFADIFKCKALVNETAHIQRGVVLL